MFRFSHFARAQIISTDIASDSVKIIFIDYGNVTDVLRNSLCVIQSQFIDLAPFALKCSLYNCQITTEVANTVQVIEK